LPTGTLNAITDVPEVQVGHSTVSWGDPPGAPGAGPARTGVTAIWPHRRGILDYPVPAGTHVINGTGEITCMTEINELGLLASPILLTNSMQIGGVYDATVRYLLERDHAIGRVKSVVMPVVGECDDSYLNDSRGLHVKPEHVWAALDSASTGPVAEGCVGSGTGMTCFGFKGGIGTSSRVVEIAGRHYTVGVLVMSNFGRRHRLTVAGVPIGELIPATPPATSMEPRKQGRHEEGSAIVVAATDAPLTNHDLARLARRAGFGLVRTGSVGGNTSGEIALAFSTAYTLDVKPFYSVELPHVFATDLLWEAATDAAEEAILNSLCMAATTEGRDGHVEHAIPLDRLQEILRASGRVT
jgi:D-aminopeptidase